MKRIWGVFCAEADGQTLRSIQNHLCDYCLWKGSIKQLSLPYSLACQSVSWLFWEGNSSAQTWTPLDWCPRAKATGVETLPIWGAVRQKGKEAAFQRVDGWLWARSQQIRAGSLAAASQSPKFSITCMRLLADLHTECKPSTEFQPASFLYFPAKTLFEVWSSVLPTLKSRKGLPGILWSSALLSATFHSILHNKIKLARGGRDPSVKCSHAKQSTGRKQGLHPLEDKR